MCGRCVTPICYDFRTTPFGIASRDHDMTNPFIVARTARDQKAVKTAADTLRQNPRLDIERAITELAVGEALGSILGGRTR